MAKDRARPEACSSSQSGHKRPGPEVGVEDAFDHRQDAARFNRARESCEVSFPTLNLAQHDQQHRPVEASAAQATEDKRCLDEADVFAACKTDLPTGPR
jgi:hypothetical protein